VQALLTDPQVRETHYRWASSAPRRRGAPDATQLTAWEKISEARSLDEALGWLEPRELVQLAGHRAMAEQLARLAGGDLPETVAHTSAHAGVDLAAQPAQIRTPAA
jgi:membrane glycosyltransferase